MTAELTPRELLADYTAQHGQRAAADRLGYSATTVNQYLNGTYTADSKHLEQAIRENLRPDENWLGVLRLAARQQSQDLVAMRVGVAASTLSQVLSGTYKANTLRVERRVRGVLMDATCHCPVMGEVSTRVCQEVQERSPKAPGGLGNPQHAQAWHACRGSGRFMGKGSCPHFNCGASAAQPAKGDQP